MDADTLLFPFLNLCASAFICGKNPLLIFPILLGLWPLKEIEPQIKHRWTQIPGYFPRFTQRVLTLDPIYSFHWSVSICGNNPFENKGSCGAGDLTDRNLKTKKRDLVEIPPLTPWSCRKTPPFLCLRRCRLKSMLLDKLIMGFHLHRGYRENNLFV